MLLVFLATVALIVILCVTFVATRPPGFRIAREAVIPVLPARVFPLVNDFRHWEQWSPWAKRDPDMEQRFEGAASGEGAAYSWTGNREFGAGRMTITESRPDERVRIRLEFLKPFKATNTAEFTFESLEEGTRVTWSMVGNKNFLFKAVGIFMDMDKMIGRDFEAGLDAMRAAATSDEA